MVVFDVFSNSVKPLRLTTEDHQEVQPGDMNEKTWDILAAVFRGIKIMASGTRL